MNSGVTMAQYEHGVLRVIDGDTLVISATYLPPTLRPELLLRISGIDAPERGWRAELKEGLLLTQPNNCGEGQQCSRAAICGCIRLIWLIKNLGVVLG